MSAHEYTQEQFESDCRERNRLFREKWGRDMEWDDVLASFGGRNLGQTHSLFTLIREGFYYCGHCDRIVELDDDTESPAKCPRCKKRTVEWQKPVELNETV